jgi:proline iminopeptidase
VINNYNIKDAKLDYWPLIAPFEEGYLSVSKIHNIHYALYGNPEGEPVMFFHGGPGSGCTDEDARWFDPKKYLIILHDQRGNGKSTPLAEINENTTQLLIDDIEKLRKHLNIKTPFSVFAGSWEQRLRYYMQKHIQRIYHG